MRRSPFDTLIRRDGNAPQGRGYNTCPAITLLHSENPTRRRKVDVDHGWVAQLAEQWTENPRVGGSIPPPATPSENLLDCLTGTFDGFENSALS